SPMAIGNTPVASGSRVPACPTFLPVRRRITSTTRFEVRPSGLSTTSQPSRPPLLVIGPIIRQRLGLGGLRPEVTRHLGPRQQGGHSIDPIKRIVEREDEVWCVAQLNFPRDERFEECGAALEARDYFGCVRSGQRHDERGRVAQIRAHPDFGDGYAHLLDHRVAAFAVAQNSRQRMPHLFTDAKLTLARCSLDPGAERRLLPAAPLLSHSNVLRHALQSTRHFLYFETLDDIAHLDVVIVLESHTALVSLIDLADFVLEALQSF